MCHGKPMNTYLALIDAMLSAGIAFLLFGIIAWSLHVFSVLLFCCIVIYKCTRNCVRFHLNFFSPSLLFCFLLSLHIKVLQAFTTLHIQTKS